MISWDGGFLIWADQCGAVWAMPAKLGAAPVAYVCMHHGGLSVGSGWCGCRFSCCYCFRYNRCCGPSCWGGRQGCGCSECYIAAGRCTKTDGIWMTFVNVVTGTLVVFPHQCLVLGISHCWLHRWQWQGATGSWHHLGLRQSDQQRVGMSFCSLSCHNMQHSRMGIHRGSHDQLKYVDLCSIYAVVLWCIMPIDTEVLQKRTDVHWQVCYSMLGDLSMDPGQNNLHG